MGRESRGHQCRVPSKCETSRMLSSKFPYCKYFCLAARAHPTRVGGRARTPGPPRGKRGADSLMGGFYSALVWHSAGHIPGEERPSKQRPSECHLLRERAFRGGAGQKIRRTATLPDCRGSRVCRPLGVEGGGGAGRGEKSPTIHTGCAAVESAPRGGWGIRPQVLRGRGHLAGELLDGDAAPDWAGGPIR